MKSPKIILDTIKKTVAEAEIALSPEIKANLCVRNLKQFHSIENNNDLST